MLDVAGIGAMGPPGARGMDEEDARSFRHEDVKATGLGRADH
jgi:hypothetical protein